MIQVRMNNEFGMYLQKRKMLQHKNVEQTETYVNQRNETKVGNYEPFDEPISISAHCAHHCVIKCIRNCWWYVTWKATTTLCRVMPFALTLIEKVMHFSLNLAARLVCVCVSIVHTKNVNGSVDLTSLFVDYEQTMNTKTRCSMKWTKNEKTMDETRNKRKKNRRIFARKEQEKLNWVNECNHVETSNSSSVLNFKPQLISIQHTDDDFSAYVCNGERQTR